MVRVRARARARARAGLGANFNPIPNPDPNPNPNPKLARDLQAAAAKTAVPAKASEVPKSWTGTVDPLLTSVVELEPGAEYDRVTTAFMASLGGRGITVVSVSRVQSLPMWTTYAAKRHSVLTNPSPNPNPN